MLQEILALPEGVYYRGRFRATTAWSKVSQGRRGSGSNTGDDEGSQGDSVPGSLLVDRLSARKNETAGMQTSSAGS
jgi:hypothetical protein